MNWLRSLAPFRGYVLFAALVYGVFTWAGWHGYRLLGDDNDQSENLNGNGYRSSGGRASYFHK